MNYEKIYYTFVQSFKNQTIDDGVYTETHHVVPRHAGGDDSPDNLVVVTYRQHVFLHRLLWKAYNRPQDLAAYRLMSRIVADKKIELCSMAGKIGGAKNRDSGHMSRIGKEYGTKRGQESAINGHLDKIRTLANTPEQLKHASELGKQNVISGKLAEVAKKAYKVRADRSEQRSQQVIETAQRNEDFLHRTSSRSKFDYVSPEGLVFCSAYAAAMYYGNEEPNVILSWCERGRFGWSKIPKTATN